MKDDDDNKKETGPEWLIAMKAAGEASEDQTVDALAKIGSFVVDHAQSVDRRCDSLDGEIDKANRNAEKSASRLSAEMEAGFSVMADRLDNIKKSALVRGSYGGGSGGTGDVVFSGGDRMLAVIPDDCKHLVRQAEQTVSYDRRSAKLRGRDSDDLGQMVDPVFKAATALWFRTAMRLQLPKQYGGHQTELRETLDRLERGFDNVYGGYTDEQKAAYSGGSNATGGYLIPTAVAAEVLRIVQDNGVVVPRARHIPMSGLTLEIPNEATGVTVYWGAGAGGGQGGNLTAGEGTFGVNTLEAKRLHGRAAANIEAVDDSIVGLIPFITEVMAEKMARELDKEALEGTGTNFTGLNAEGGINTVSTTTSNGENVTFLDLVSAVYAADESSVEAGSAWFMHRKIFATVVGLTDSQGRPIFMPSVSPGIPGTILGFPVYTTSVIATNTTRGATSNTSNMYFGDPKRLIFGDRQDLRFDVTETGPGWANYQIDMRLVGRFGFTVGTPAAFSRIVGCTQLA